MTKDEMVGWYQRRERLPTPVFWPGEFHGLYSPWGRKVSDTTEHLSLHLRKIPGRIDVVISEWDV